MVLLSLASPYKVFQVAFLKPMISREQFHELIKGTCKRTVWRNNRVRDEEIGDLRGRLKAALR